MVARAQAMDMFSLEATDPTTGVSSLLFGLRNLQMPILVMGVRSDMLFPLEQQIEIRDRLEEVGNKHVSFYTLDSVYGHDTFLIDTNNIGAAVKGHLEQRLGDSDPSIQTEGSSECPQTRTTLQQGDEQTDGQHGPNGSQQREIPPQWLPSKTTLP